MLVLQGGRSFVLSASCDRPVITQWVGESGWIELPTVFWRGWNGQGHSDNVAVLLSPDNCEPCHLCHLWQAAQSENTMEQKALGNNFSALDRSKSWGMKLLSRKPHNLCSGQKPTAKQLANLVFLANLAPTHYSKKSRWTRRPSPYRWFDIIILHPEESESGYSLQTQILINQAPNVLHFYIRRGGKGTYIKTSSSPKKGRA